MRILQIYNLHRFRGGADNATIATVNLIEDKGHEVRSLVYSSKDLRSDIAGKLKAFCSGFYSPSALHALRLLLDEFHPDIVHAHKLYPLITPWILPLCKQRNIPVVMSVYDYQLTCPVGTHSFDNAVCTRCTGGRAYWGVVRNCRDRLPESIAYAGRHALADFFDLYRKHVDLFITPTLHAGRWLQRYSGVPAARIVAIPCMFDVPHTPTDPGQGEYVAYAGRFARQKGIAVIAEAAKETGLPFQLAGDAPALDLTAELPEVTVRVTRSKEELAQFYRKARMLVAPSLWFETFPLVIGEAMSHGVPVIASRIGGLPEIVEDGVTGFLVEPGDAKDLASKIRMLWNDPGLCRRLGQASYDKILRTSHREVIFERISAVYDQVLTGNSLNRDGVAR